jgi:hypothetical protein
LRVFRFIADPLAERFLSHSKWIEKILTKAYRPQFHGILAAARALNHQQGFDVPLTGL